MLDDAFRENGILMTQDVEPVKKELVEVTPKDYIKNINLDGTGRVAKKAVKTDIGYTLSLSAIAGIGMSIYFHTFEPFAYFMVAGIVTDVALRIADKTKYVEFK